MRHKYQKFIVTMGFARAIVESAKPKARIFVKNPLKIHTKTLKSTKNAKNMQKIATQNLAFFFVEIKLGKKLCVKAPSLNTRRKRLGNLKATKNISL